MPESSSRTDILDASSVDADEPSRLIQVLQDHFGDSDLSSDPAEQVLVAQAPGRVNLLGGHTDYSGGFVLPATIDRTAQIALRPRGDTQGHLYSVNFDETVTFDLVETPVGELPPWARYVAGVAAALRQQGYTVQGFEAALHGDVPLGAGLSSSAALEVATAVGLDALFELDLDPIETARLCQRTEQEYVGVECGIMDQFSSRIGRADHALFLDCRSLEHEHLPLPISGPHCLVVADSGVRRELASSKYNERRRECEEAARFFRQFDEEVRTLRDVSAALLEAHGQELPTLLFRRARHVVLENQRVRQGAALLAEGNLEAFGRLMNASHASLADDYEVSCAELNCLAETARETEGVLGSRMTGAGFGGCTVTLARAEAAPHLKRALEAHYRQRFDRPPEVYVVKQNLEAGVL